eukprot:6212347-Pleurochrysis_carterae.AAC.1
MIRVQLQRTGAPPMLLLYVICERARVIQVDKHALSLLAQVVRREGQAASQQADSVQEVRPGRHGNVKHATHKAPVAGLAVKVHHVAASSLAANCVVNEGGQLLSCGHVIVGVDTARKDLVSQLGDVALVGAQVDHARSLTQADRDKFLKIGAEVGPAKVGREVLAPFVTQGGAARLCGNDVVDVEQHNQHLVAPDHVKEARVVLGLGEAKLDEDLAGRLVPLASGGGVLVHVANLCNNLAAVLVPPLVARWDVGVDLL